jgi:hypothetical protein
MFWHRTGHRGVDASSGTILPADWKPSIPARSPDEEMPLQNRNATVAVIGAGDHVCEIDAGSLDARKEDEFTSSATARPEKTKKIENQRQPPVKYR